MRVYKLYASNTSGGNNLASVQIVRNSVIRAVAFACNFIANASAYANWELSASATAQTTVNDTIGPIAEARFSSGVVTSGGIGSIHPGISGLDIKIGAGEKLYANCAVAGTIASNACAIYVYVDEK